MTNMNGFDANQFEHSIEDIQALVNEVNRVNQEIYRSYQNYLGESFSGYAAHMQSLMGAKSPMEFFTLQGRYVEENSSRFQRLMQQRYELFNQLNQKLQSKYNIMFLFPEAIQKIFSQFQNSGNLEWFSPQVWSDFAQKLSGK